LSDTNNITGTFSDITEITGDWYISDSLYDFWVDEDDEYLVDENGSKIII